MSVDVCEGCRRLRKRCDKDNCVLQPCLETLWSSNKVYQGNATVFLAKYFGRKRFFELLQDVTTDERPGITCPVGRTPVTLKRLDSMYLTH